MGNTLIESRILILIILVISRSCNQELNDEPKELNSDIQTTESMFLESFCNTRLTDSLRNGIIDGNYLMYTELRDIYLLSDKKEEFLYYALIMAEVYQNKEAKKDLYYILEHDSVMSKTKFAKIILSNDSIGE